MLSHCVSIYRETFPELLKFIYTLITISLKIERRRKVDELGRKEGKDLSIESSGTSVL